MIPMINNARLSIRSGVTEMTEKNGGARRQMKSTGIWTRGLSITWREIPKAPINL